MAATFTITKQQQTQIIGPDGQLADAMRVEFLATNTNVAGSLEVPLADFTPEHVQQLVGDRVQVIDAVAAL